MMRHRAARRHAPGPLELGLIEFVSALLTNFFFFNDTATTEIYTLSLHDALPICLAQIIGAPPEAEIRSPESPAENTWKRSEEHTSELQSRLHLVCRLLLEKKKKLSAIAQHLI